jgi:hypothetical protein
MRHSRKWIAALAAGTVLAGGVAGGVAVAGGSGGSGQSFTESLADALNARAGTSLTAENVQAALKDLFKERLDSAVTDGRLTQAQADQLLRQFDQDGLRGGLGPGFGGPWLGGPDVVKADFLAPAASALGLSQDALRAQLQSGKTLAQVAEDRGVARDAVVAAIAKELQGANSGLTEAEAQRMAGDIVDNAPGSPELRLGFPGAKVDILSVAAKTLGVTESVLRDQLEGGKTLAQVAEDRGVARGAVVAAIAKELQSANSGLTEAEAQRMAGDIVDNTPRPPHPPRGLVPAPFYGP